MNDCRDFKKEYDVFLNKVPYQTAVVDGVKVRYQYGGKDGGVYAQIFAKRHPKAVLTMILTTTLTVDSDYVRDIQKERFSTPILLFLLKLVPAKTELNLLLKKSKGFLECESEEDRKYGRRFYETVASDLNYKQRFIHSFKCVYMLKDYPLFKETDFEYLRGKIQVLIPEKDMFKKEDQNRLVELFRKLDAVILNVPGGHVGFIVQADHYIDLIEKFLKKNGF